MGYITNLQSVFCFIQMSTVDPEILKVAGQIAGIGGIAVGSLIIIFREIIHKNIFPNLAKQQAYRLLVLITFLVWSVAIAGIAAWVYVNSSRSGNGSGKPVVNEPAVKEFQLSGLVRDERGDGVGDAEITVVGGAERDQTTSNGAFRLILKRERGEPVRLRVVKKGYRPWDENVDIPKTNLIIPIESAEAETPPANKTQRGRQTRNRNPTNRGGANEKAPVLIDEVVTKPL